MNVTFGESEVFLCFSSVISSWLWQQLQHYLLSAVKLVAEELGIGSDASLSY